MTNLVFGFLQQFGGIGRRNRGSWHHNWWQTKSLDFLNNLYFVIISSLNCLLSCSHSFYCNSSRNNIRRNFSRNLSCHLNLFCGFLNSTWARLSYSSGRYWNFLLNPNNWPNTPTKYNRARTYSRKLFFGIIILSDTYSFILGGRSLWDYFRRGSCTTLLTFLTLSRWSPCALWWPPRWRNSNTVSWFWSRSISDSYFRGSGFSVRNIIVFSLNDLKLIYSWYFVWACLSLLSIPGFEISETTAIDIIVLGFKLAIKKLTTKIERVYEFVYFCIKLKRAIVHPPTKWYHALAPVYKLPTN